MRHTVNGNYDYSVLFSHFVDRIQVTEMSRTWIRT